MRCWEFIPSQNHLSFQSSKVTHQSQRSVKETKWSIGTHPWNVYCVCLTGQGSGLLRQDAGTTHVPLFGYGCHGETSWFSEDFLHESMAFVNERSA